MSWPVRIPHYGLVIMADNALSQLHFDQSLQFVRVPRIDLLASKLNQQDLGET